MTAVKDLSVEQLRSLIGDVIEEKLRELLSDPDEGLGPSRGSHSAAKQPQYPA